MAVDQLDTKIMLRRRHYNTQAGVYCVLCVHNSEIDIEHLFFACPFATSCWNRLSIQWNLGLDLHQRICQARQAFPHNFFMEVFLAATWELWKLRNAVIFDNVQSTVHL